MRRRSFRKLFAPAEDHRGRRARRLTSMPRHCRLFPCVEVAEQRLSLSAVGVSAPSATVAAQVDQGSRFGEVVPTGTVVNRLMENRLISA